MAKATKKAKTVYVCQECGYESAKWLGSVFVVLGAVL
jgi:predicted ATP-dependent serine protease